MLNHIHISNLITIHQLDLECQHHTTVITGETGAGKSILIDAIELALGGRATSDKVRTGQDKADISLQFDLTHLHAAREWLKQYDLDEGNDCIIRRTIHHDGRSRCYINNQPITLQPLREFSERLIQIHGQHEHQSLLKADFQRLLLDRFAGHTELLNTVDALADEYSSLNKEINALNDLFNERSSRSDFLRYQLDELESANLLPDEFQTLDLEHKQLANAGDLRHHIHHALGLLTDHEESNAIQHLHQALHALETIQSVDPKIATWTESIKNAIIHVSDTEDELHRYLEHIDLDPERLQWLETRISTLFDLGRKHKVAPNELYELQQKIKTEYTALETSDARLSELTTQLQVTKMRYTEAANKLSLSRKKSARKLEKEITQLIHELSLPTAEFHIIFEAHDASVISPHGIEKIIFHIKTNAGQSMQPLAKIASGGELSRISLAIHMATALQNTTPTLIFDEVDVGIGGGTAETVGKLLRRLGENHQVFCITHQPQVASQGHQHIHVKKVEKNNATFTHIHTLSADDKMTEIARMLGGIELTQTTLAHAKEMIERVV